MHCNILNEIRNLFCFVLMNNRQVDVLPLWWLKKEGQTLLWTNRGTRRQCGHYLMYNNCVINANGHFRFTLEFENPCLNWWNWPSAGSSRLSGRSLQGLCSTLRPDASCAATGRVWYPWQLAQSLEYPEILWTAACTSKQPQWYTQKKGFKAMFVVEKQHPLSLIKA